MSHNNSPHASTHASSLSPPPQYLKERRTPETQPSSSGSYDAPFYHQEHGHPRRATVPGYSTNYPYRDPGLGMGDASGLVAPAPFESDPSANGVLPYPSATRDSPYPITGSLPSISHSNDMYLNTAASGFDSSQLSSNYPDVSMGAVQNDYFDPSTFANQQPSNPAVERNLIENIVQNALSAQQALDRGEQFAVKERLAEITRALRDLGLSKGVLGLDGVLPSLVDDSSIPNGAVSAPSLSPPLMGAGSSPLMYVGSVGGVEAGIPPPTGGAKRAAELDEGPKKALKLTPPRDLENGINSSPGHSPPLGGPPNVNGMLMHGFAPMAFASGGLNRSVVASGLAGAHPPPLMHAHTFPGGLHAPHVSSPLAGMSYENNMGATAVSTMPPPESALPAFRSEPGSTPPLQVDPYNSHMFSQPPMQGHHAGYHVSRPPSSLSMHSDESDDESDEGHRHVKQEYGTASNVPLGRSTGAPRHTPPKPRGSLGGGYPGDATPEMNPSSTMAHSANILPPELKSEVDRVFFKFLNKICSNLEATDSKGEAIHQTLMAKKMARLDELPDFRPFKFRIQAFTNGFLEELASEGYPDEVIPMKKIKSYLWNQPYISRFNEDGKKAKSKGNHIWNIDARKIDEGGSIRWTFREFKRKIAGTPPGIAYHGHHWQWAPHVWDPQLSRANITASFSSPALPSWLSWADNVLSGTPGPDAINTDITVHAKVLNDSDDHILSHTFHLTIAPSAVDPAFVKSRRPSLAHDTRRNVSDSAVNGNGMRARAASTSSNPSDNHQVMQVLASAVSRVTHAAHAAQVHNGVDHAAALVKQQQVLGITAQAVADEVRAGPHPDSQGTASVLVAAAHSVVVGAAQLVATDRVTQATRNAVDPNVMAPNQAPISVTEVSVATQSAVAHAVALNGPMATEVEVMMTANALIQQQQIASTNEAFEAQATSHLLSSTPSGSVSPQLGQIGDHRSRSMSSLGNSGAVMPMSVGMVSGLGPGLDGMSAIPQPSMHGMPGMVSNGMQ
ncbi:unnamed protein product [Rhizoctonia solani]|uniref:Uncharacterized protein n=1 Tax=Rhizoctonia solani TaxID=456999 RepID=A0A8H3AVJ3_9AGAM|nr:unnamed protein product [Rhizoctonia solani]